MKTTIKIIRNERNMPQGKLADAELHFSGGELDGLKLIGFGVWERRVPNREVQADGYGTYRLNVTFPARSFTVHGDRRHFALVRAIADRLCISEATVRHHLTSIFAKLGVLGRVELVIYAYRHGLACFMPHRCPAQSIHVVSYQNGLKLSPQQSQIRKVVER
jgi:hypothetical protein